MDLGVLIPKSRGGRYIEQPILVDNISIFWVIWTIYQYRNIPHPINIDDISILIYRPPLHLDDISKYIDIDIVSIYLQISMFLGFFSVYIWYNPY